MLTLSSPLEETLFNNMMRRFVKRVLNSPQRRCQSIKQVALEMSGEQQSVAYQQWRRYTRIHQDSPRWLKPWLRPA